VFHPLREGWAGFASLGDVTIARRLVDVAAGDPPEALAPLLLLPFRDLLHDAARLRIAAYGALDRVDFHALPWEGRPLVASLPVAYAVDAPGPAPALAPTNPATPRALLVADPLDDLPAARREITRAAAALAQRGWRVDRIDGADATHAKVRAALDAPDLALFHYAGHALFEGRDGWESGLPLAAGGWLTVGDLLALPRSPDLVILSGCETARTADAARAEGLGLAQAFALAGARGVVATTRPVRDDLAPALIAAFYERALDPLALASPPDFVAALAGAQRTIRADLPATDWSSFRAMVH
jgi:CHAT domain-containing protein